MQRRSFRRRYTLLNNLLLCLSKKAYETAKCYPSRWPTTDEVYRMMVDLKLFTASCDLSFSELIDLAVKRGFVCYDVAKGHLLSLRSY